MTTEPSNNGETPAPKTPGAAPSPLNETQLASLTKTEEICRIALKSEYLTALITLEEGETPSEDDVTKAAIEAILTLCDQARGKGTAAVAATGDKREITDEEKNAKTTLLTKIRFIQARARQKHFFKSPNILSEYGIGAQIDNSRSLLEGWAQTIYDKTATDKLPKVTAAVRTALHAALTEYKKSQTEQTGAIGVATTTRIDRDALVERATAGRIWLQFAADAEWPHSELANAPIRREFQLPATRPFLG